MGADRDLVRFSADVYGILFVNVTGRRLEQPEDTGTLIQVPCIDIVKSSRIGFRLVIHLDHLVTMIRPRSLFRPLALRFQLTDQSLQFGTNVQIESTDHFLDASHIFVKRFDVIAVTVTNADRSRTLGTARGFDGANRFAFDPVVHYLDRNRVVTVPQVNVPAQHVTS